MADFLLFRHAPTEWNARKRIQGRTDVPLSDAGRREASGWRVPAFARGWPCRASPLRRARETAEAMGLAPLADPAFVEMDWGRAEGATLEALRAEGGGAFRDSEARGLDFRPDGGESPREVGARALAGLARLPESAVIVTHKGVLRALLAIATGWNMATKPTVRLQAAAAHHFRLEGRLMLIEPNIALSERKVS